METSKERRKRQKEYERKRGAKNRRQLIGILGGPKCGLCPEIRYKELEIDHVFNDGNEDRKRFATKGHNNGFFEYYIKHPEQARKRLRVLCKMCHEEKHRIVE